MQERTVLAWGFAVEELLVAFDVAVLPFPEQILQTEGDVEDVERDRVDRVAETAVETKDHLEVVAVDLVSRGDDDVHAHVVHDHHREFQNFRVDQGQRRGRSALIDVRSARDLPVFPEERDVDRGKMVLVVEFGKSRRQLLPSGRIEAVRLVLRVE